RSVGRVAGAWIWTLRGEGGGGIRPRAGSRGPVSSIGRRPSRHMKKNYVLDTNVLLHDPFAIYKFEDNDLILPIYVIEEIDQFKRESTERGRNARTITRLLDEERAKNGSLAQGVPIGDGGSLRVHVPDRRPRLEIALNPHSGDHAVLQTA